jgi:hypothetical protein
MQFNINITDMRLLKQNVKCGGNLNREHGMGVPMYNITK